MSVCRGLQRLTVAIALAALCAGHAPAWAVDERAAHLLELSIAYGDASFSSAVNLVLDPHGMPDIPGYSLPYAVALLERGIFIPRAQAVVGVVLGAQDKRAESATRGLFQWRPGDAYSHAATRQVAPLLARLHARHAARLGAGTTERITQAMELALGALQRGLEGTPTDEALLTHAALAQLGRALGKTPPAAAAVAAVERWLAEVNEVGRTWSPAPHADAMRILALQRIWEGVPAGSQAPVERALRLCYLDLAQRVQPTLAGLAGAAQTAYPEEYLDNRGFVSYLIYRDFGLRLPARARPPAVGVALSQYRPPESIVSLVRPEFEPYIVETNSVHEGVAAQTTTYVGRNFTLGTMSSWCGRDTVPAFATFTRHAGRPTAYFNVRGAAAHVSALQYGNMAICSFNFDRIGVDKALQAWVEGRLAGAGEVEAIYARGEEWNGEPMAIGARDTVVVRRGGVYLAVTVLEAGVPGEDPGFRRKPGVLEWQGIGEHASLTLSIYARHENYPLRRPLDDVRAGFVIQLWDEDQFDADMGIVRWLDAVRLTQAHETRVVRTPAGSDAHPVLERYRPQPRQRQTSRSQKLHTIQYAYQRGRGNTFELVEDLRHEEVLERTLNGQPLDNAVWWSSPAFTWQPGQSLLEALDPPPPDAAADAP